MSRGVELVVRDWGILAALTIVSAAGCGPKSAEQAVDRALKNAGQTRADIFPLAGKVTIDGHAPDTRPGGTKHVIIILTDPAKLDGPMSSRSKAICQPDGTFTFSTYGTGDGAAPGKYVVTIVELSQERRRGWMGPDGLKNLYNDPEKNANTEEFVIDHKAPGKTNYVFDLKVEGREAAQPGPHSVTAYH
jgi:hypothetical protein